MPYDLILLYAFAFKWHRNGAPMYSAKHIKETGEPLMLDENGRRSVFCDLND